MPPAHPPYPWGCCEVSTEPSASGTQATWEQGAAVVVTQQGGSPSRMLLSQTCPCT